MWHAIDSEAGPRALACDHCSRSVHGSPSLRSLAAATLPLGLVGATQVPGAAGASERREPQVIEVRPDGLAGGKYAWPAWAIGVVGFALVAVALAVWLIRVRDSRKQ